MTVLCVFAVASLVNETHGVLAQLSERLKTNTAIDQVSQKLPSLEVKHWKEVFRRLTAIVSHLAECNLAFRGHSDRLFETGNGNFLGQIELMSQFDPMMREHLRRTQANELSHNYLSKHIQNELINILAKKYSRCHLLREFRNPNTSQSSWTPHQILVIKSNCQ